MSTSPSGAALRELDVVELTAGSGRWPTGTAGTIVELKADHALVEVADRRGHTLDFVEMPLAFLRRCPSFQQERLSV